MGIENRKRRMCSFSRAVSWQFLVIMLMLTIIIIIYSRSRSRSKE